MVWRDAGNEFPGFSVFWLLSFTTELCFCMYLRLQEPVSFLLIKGRETVLYVILRRLVMVVPDCVSSCLR